MTESLKEINILLERDTFAGSLSYSCLEVLCQTKEKPELFLHHRTSVGSLGQLKELHRLIN